MIIIIFSEVEIELCDKIEFLESNRSEFNAKRNFIAKINTYYNAMSVVFSISTQPLPRPSNPLRRLPVRVI